MDLFVLILIGLLLMMLLSLSMQHGSCLISVLDIMLLRHLHSEISELHSLLQVSQN